ncbi:hypothetical protein HWV62_3609 [Athelia sp. TMB]|nr:hypothetical protein HWV62_3609 [Athelia sp. TMB]
MPGVLTGRQSQKSSDDDRTSRDEDTINDSSSESSENSDDDAEMQELLRENSESGSSDEDVADTTQKSTTTKERDKKHGYDRYDSPVGNIAVLMLACWTMRIPVMYEDFRKIIELHQLPYMDPVRLLPESFIAHLTKYTVRTLSPQHAPTTLVAHRLTSRLARRFYSSHGILTPEVNAAPMLWRIIRSMGGTPVLYGMAKALGRVLSLPLTLHHSLAPTLKRAKQRDPDSHKYDSVPPEVAFVATSVIILKMVYGLDGTSRVVPLDSSDPACTLPRLNELLALMRGLEISEMETLGETLRSDRHMFVVTALVRLLLAHGPNPDFCEKTLLRPGKEAQTTLVDYFPLSKESPDLQMSVEPFPFPLPRVLKEWNEDATPGWRPGQVYTVYNTQDILGSIPDQYAGILCRAARLVGVADDYLNGVIEKYERRLMRWWDGEKRKSEEIKGHEEELEA